MLALSESPIGKEQTVKWIVGNQNDADNVRNLGITEGSSVKVVGSFFGSVIVALDQFRFAIDSDLAWHIKVG